MKKNNTWYKPVFFLSGLFAIIFITACFFLAFNDFRRLKDCTVDEIMHPNRKVKYKLIDKIYFVLNGNFFTKRSIKRKLLGNSWNLIEIKNQHGQKITTNDSLSCKAMIKNTLMFFDSNSKQFIIWDDRPIIEYSFIDKNNILLKPVEPSDSDLSIYIKIKLEKIEDDTLELSTLSQLCCTSFDHNHSFSFPPENIKYIFIKQ